MDTRHSPFGPLGSLTKEDDVNVITFQRRFAAAPAAVWEAIATGDGLAAWLSIEASVEPELDGAQCTRSPSWLKIRPTPREIRIDGITRLAMMR